MPGSLTTPGRMGTRAIVLMRVAFHNGNSVSTRNQKSYAAQWLAYALPYRRFACTLAGTCARLGADAVRYSFTVVDSHHLLLAGLTGAPQKFPSRSASVISFDVTITTGHGAASMAHAMPMTARA